MQEFNPHDRVLRKGTMEPVYKVLGKTKKVKSSSPEDYLKFSDNLYTCDREDGLGNPEEIDGENLQLIK